MAAALLRQARAGDDEAYAELYHQVCHQFTLGLVAYVVVPHLVDIARSVDVKRRVAPLNIVGLVAAVRFAAVFHPPAVPVEWEAEYLQANAEALVLTADALRQSGWAAWESRELLATLAALHGHTDVATHMFLSGNELTCPECGEEITYTKPSR